MSRLILTCLITVFSATTKDVLIAQNLVLDFAQLKAFEHQLDDVMEIIDTNELKVKLTESIESHQKNPTVINTARLGIIFHETALNLSFFNKTTYKGYAQKSYDALTKMAESPNTPKELMPFVASYRASALALVAGETRKLKLLSEAFTQFEAAVKNYAHVSYLPEFLRGSVAENLPWFMSKKKKFAKIDMQSIIEKYEKNKDYGTGKVMSFTYWAWANQRQNQEYRSQALAYLEKAIALDPNFKAGRKRAEELKAKLSR